MMSDLHFDPMADRRLVDRLAAAEPEQWCGVLESFDDTALGPYGRDTSWMLLRSVLRQMRDALPEPAFVLVPGDFLAHDFRRKFDGAARDHSNDAYRLFVRNTMRFLAQQLEQTFPATPILPALGNNDDECGDYQLQPGGPFLADTLPILRTLVRRGAKPAFDQDWTSYGNYSISVGGVRVLSTNTNFFSIHYRNGCGLPGDADPGRATLAWLEAELAAARQARERVWLIFHIPPGIDGYATLRKGTCPGAMIAMWDRAYTEPFYALLRHYADTVVASFAGHTHMDDFRLIGDADGRYAFTLITPAVSPIFGQNPAFRTVVYDAVGGILDQTTYDLTNLPEAAVTGNLAPVWRAEYTFTQQWALPRVDLPSLTRLYSLIEKMPEQRARWHTIFPVSSPVYWPQVAGGDSGAQAAQAFRCASGNVLLPDYRQCYCGGHS
jgi:sphingomyelin phosphodiesterase acid-like 3